MKTRLTLRVINLIVDGVLKILPSPCGGYVTVTFMF
jgi:hypothetical protein